MRDHPARRRAPLPGRPHGAEENGTHGEIEASAFGDDDGVVAAELENRATEARGHGSGHLAPDGRRTRE
jgi:hypothetical protein